MLSLNSTLELHAENWGVLIWIQDALDFQTNPRNEMDFETLTDSIRVLRKSRLSRQWALFVES
jgi:hypothetical protein